LFGIGGATASIDKECETRNNAAVVITGLKDETLAREILCQIKDVRDAAVRVGKPCLQDQPTPRVASAVPETPTPKTAAVEPAKPAKPDVAEPAIKHVAAAVPIQANAPPFCRVKGLDVTLYPECTTMQAPVAHSVATAKQPVSETNKGKPVWTRPHTAPAEKPAPDSSVGNVQTDAAWAQPVSYTPAKPAPMIAHAVATIPVKTFAPTDSVARYLEHGAAMIAAGDIAAARLYFERAVGAGSGQAAVEMGKTYDPVFLARIHAVGIQPNPTTADMWYHRAITLGDPKAARLPEVAAR